MLTESIAGSGCPMPCVPKDKKSREAIERSLTKTYRRTLWSKFIKAIKDFELVQPGDHIAVAVSGGKDSMLMAKLFQELKKHQKFDFTVSFLAMDPGYHPRIRQLLLDNCEHLAIPVSLFNTDIFAVVDRVARDYPCYLCAKMRRGSLYAKARELGCNKLALGHHYNDVIETTMLNVLYAGIFKTMLPKLHSANFTGLELIRPLYYIREADIIRYTENSGLWPLNCACMVAAKKTGNKRYEIKALIAQLKENFADVEKSIFRSALNVNLDGIVGWKKDGKQYSYLDYYNADE